MVPQMVSVDENVSTLGKSGRRVRQLHDVSTKCLVVYLKLKIMAGYLGWLVPLLSNMKTLLCHMVSSVNFFGWQVHIL